MNVLLALPAPSPQGPATKPIPIVALRRSRVFKPSVQEEIDKVLAQKPQYYIEKIKTAKPTKTKKYMSEVDDKATIQYGNAVAERRLGQFYAVLKKNPWMLNYADVWMPTTQGQGVTTWFFSPTGEIDEVAGTMIRHLLATGANTSSPIARPIYLLDIMPREYVKLIMFNSSAPSRCSPVFLRKFCMDKEIIALYVVTGGDIKFDKDLISMFLKSRSGFTQSPEISSDEISMLRFLLDAGAFVDTTLLLGAMRFSNWGLVADIAIHQRCNVNDSFDGGDPIFFNFFPAPLGYRNGINADELERALSQTIWFSQQNINVKYKDKRGMTYLHNIAREITDFKSS